MFLKQVLICLLLLLILPSKVFAQEAPVPYNVYAKGEVLEIVKDEEKDVGGTKIRFQVFRVKILEGDEKDKIVNVERSLTAKFSVVQEYKEGEKVVVIYTPGARNYAISDTYRLDYVLAILLFFFIIVFLFTGRKGLGAILGLVISLGVIVGFIVPQIINKQDPLLISIIGALVILFVTTFLAHGFSKKTTIAVVATFISLVFTYIFAVVFTQLGKIDGLGDEDAYLLLITPENAINVKGLFLGGIIIGTLGALNDITTTQVTSIFALKKTNPKEKFINLILHGMDIGKEHILSLVNTLVLAYAGTAFPLFIFIVLNPNKMPYWTILNNPILSEEIVRTVAGSLGLFLAVPISTIISAWYLTRNK